MDKPMLPLKSLLLALITATGLLACMEDPNTIDTDFFNDESFEITYVDTIELVTSTIQFDSLQTSRIGRILFGYAEDERLGKIKATSFFEVGLDSTYELNEDVAVYDSITLYLELDGYYYYDTLPEQVYTLYALMDELDYDDETGHLYNTTFSELSPDSYLEREPLGSIKISPRPYRDDEVEFRISDTLGRELIQLAYEGSEILSSSIEFSEYLRGFALVPDTLQSNSIIGFSTNSQLRVYYEDQSAIPNDQKYLTFSINQEPYFSQITYDRSTTRLHELVTREEDLNSSATDNEAYMQAGAGLGIKIRIPHIRELIFASDDFFINNAVLTLRPINNSYGPGTPLPQNLIVYIIDEDNEIIGGLENRVVLFEDIVLDRETRYEINVTAFINSQLAIEEFNENALMILPPDSLFNGTVDRLSIGDALNEYAMELTVLYISLIED